MLVTGVRNIVGWALTLALGLFGQAASAAFEITSLYSNLDGSVQFIRVTETAGAAGQNLGGLTLASTHNDTVKEITLPNLPVGAHESVAIAAMPGNDLYLPVDLSWGWYCCYLPAYREMPARFLATDGGTVELVGVERITYSRLPTNGAQALRRDGTVVQAILPGRHCGPITPPGGCPSEPQISQTRVRASSTTTAIAITTS